MWEPVGPLPASVYWRRRLVAITATLGLLVVAAWSGAAWLASPGTPAVTAVLAAVSQTAPPTTSAAPTTPADPAVVVATSGGPVAGPLPLGPGPTPAVTTGAGPSATPAGAAAVPSTPAGAGTTPPTSAGRTTEPVDPTEQLLPDDSAPRTGPAPTPVPVPAGGPVPCTNAMLAVGAEVDPATHRVGERPVLRLTVTNTSAEPCVRDLDPGRQEIVVWGLDGTRLWSSNDCSPVHRVDLRTLVPGQPVAFAVSWVGRTSAPGCVGQRTTVPAGNYNLLTRVDDDISPATSFTRTP